MHNFSKNVVRCLIFGALISPSAFATIEDKQGEVDQLFTDYLNQQSPSAGMVEIRERLSDGAIVTRYRQSYGNLTNEPTSPELPLNALMRQASVSKVLVSEVLKHAESEGLVDLDDKVFCKTNGEQDCILHRPGLLEGDITADPPTYSYYTITINNLLEHESGITDGSILNESEIFDNVLQQAYSPGIEDLINDMSSNPLTSEPGVDDDYENVNYDLAWAVLEEITSQGSAMDYVRDILPGLGICGGDVALANPFFTGAVPDREPEYYTYDHFRPALKFERPNSSDGFGNLVGNANEAGDGGGLYGEIPGGGGLLMTTRAMIRAAELAADDEDFFFGGGGPGTWTWVEANRIAAGENRFNISFAFNSNETSGVQDNFLESLRSIVSEISPTNDSQSAIDSAKASSQRYDTACEAIPTIEEPSKRIGNGETQTFTLSNADRITLFNIETDANLFIQKQTHASNNTQVQCANTGFGNNQKSCELDPNRLYRVSVVGQQAGRYMLDANFVSSQMFSSTIEAESFLPTSPLSPLQVETTSNSTFVSWPTEGEPIISASDSAAGQVHYTVRASASSMAFFATVDFNNPANDSFYFKLEGHDSAWSTQNNQQTSNFEELGVNTWTGLTPGKLYTLKILRREDGIKIDRLRLLGGEFATTESSTIEAESYAEGSPISPFETITTAEGTYITWPTSGGPIISPSDSAQGQAIYFIQATSPELTFYSVVDFDNPENDSFHYKLEGYSASWLTQNYLQTNGFEELEINTWTGLEPGKIYKLRILRREDGAKIDKLRLRGGNFLTDISLSDS